MARMVDGDKIVEALNLIAKCWSVSPFVSKEKHLGAVSMLREVEREVKEAPTLTPLNEGARDKNVPTNEPLTLDDLRKIDTVTPLWVHDLSWGRHKPRLMLVRYVASHYWSCVDFDGFEIVKADDYGSRYLIYRRPPEGEV